MVAGISKAFWRHPARSIGKVSPVLARAYRWLDAGGILSDLIADPKTSCLRPVFHCLPNSFFRKKVGPLVTVIVATRNNAPTIERSIYSLLNQSYASLEVIVVDDASNDGSKELLVNLAKIDPRVVVFTNERQRGTGESRNEGLRAARGKYVTFHDGDDFSEPNRILLQVAALEKDTSKVLCVCDYVRVNERNQTMQINDSRVMKCIISMMFVREAVNEKVGFFIRENVSEDSDFYERIKIAFGAQCEVHLLRTLYRALYRRGSSFFSSVQIIERGNRSVRYARSEGGAAAYELIRARHQEMRAGRMPIRVD